MEMALYEPRLGYYVAGMRKIGKSGDFVTAPEISPLFSHCLANQCQQVLQSLTQGSILELGAGSGIMAADMLQHLEAAHCLPEYYYILDLSPELKHRQRQTLHKYVPHLVDKVIWLEQLPQDFIGVIVGNEVLDAMPVDLFSIKAAERSQDHNTTACIYNNHIIWKDDYFALNAVPASQTLQQQVQALILIRMSAVKIIPRKLIPLTPAWCRSISQCLQQGVILLIDYGYTQSEYYLPERCMGTLICHYQHRSHNNPLIYPGLQDITANVDFTALAHAASDAQLDLLGFSNQATFLAASGLESCFLAQLQQQPQQQYHLAQQIRTLSLPAENGRTF